MLYNWLKLAHILSASLLLLSFLHGFRLWQQKLVHRIQKLTWTLILPLSFVQLLTGFMIIGIKHYQYSEIWIKGSTISFGLMLISWLGFNYFLESPHRLQKICTLTVCGISILSMIFFMANRVS